MESQVEYIERHSDYNAITYLRLVLEFTLIDREQAKCLISAKIDSIHSSVLFPQLFSTVGHQTQVSLGSVNHRSSALVYFSSARVHLQLHVYFVVQFFPLFKFYFPIVFG